MSLRKKSSSEWIRFRTSPVCWKPFSYSELIKSQRDRDQLCVCVWVCVYPPLSLSLSSSLLHHSHHGHFSDRSRYVPSSSYETLSRLSFPRFLNAPMSRYTHFARTNLQKWWPEGETWSRRGFLEKSRKDQNRVLFGLLILHHCQAALLSVERIC